ncbi:MAG: hypothetical protein GAK35_01640 [Herbaspirillum frisingense]|uniref:Uncharacterized protein n=1 Tax=Herbaspirillum frisingense TaxID=92645 RepID=A0A7V8JUY8_9BURK|nr:MAG: hypothetical protein GAK35_01640 [Herbaspirillum frisingense]
MSGKAAIQAGDAAALRDYVHDLVREKRPAAGWQSRAQAVRVIAAAALEFSEHYDGPRLNPRTMARTLERWIGQMPEASDWFPPKQVIDAVRRISFSDIGTR